MAKWEMQKHEFVGSFLAPLLLIVFPPFIPFVFLQTSQYHDRSLSAFFNDLISNPQGFISRLPSPSFYAIQILITYFVAQWALLMFLPGNEYLGAITESGSRPVYKGNPVSAFLITHWIVAGLLYSGIVDGNAIFNELPAIFAVLIPSAFLFCVYLYLDGYRNRDKPDYFVSNSVIWDFWKGVSNHPRAFGVDLKQLINCRIAMMGWGVLLLLYCSKQYALLGHVHNGLIVSVSLQLIYIYKFFVWERGYFYSIDIIHDRAGFMIIWGVLCWLPSVYTCHSYYLIYETEDIPLAYAIGIFIFGVLSIYLNYQADAQRQLARDTNGNCLIFGEAARYIKAEYVTGDGKHHKTILLTSGYWGLSRHFNYVFELALAFSWGLPALRFAIIPFFYFMFLSILLINRATRDDHRCAEKYGKYWDEYKAKVPYSILPYIY